MTALPDEVAHENVAALRDTEAEEIDEHNHVGAVGAGCQRLVANLVDEEGDDHLRQTVGDVLAHGGNANLEQVTKLLPGHGAEVVEREAGDMYAEVDDGQQHRRNGATGGCGNGSAFDTQLRTAQTTEDEGVVAHDVQHVDDARHHHGIDHLVGTAQ